MNEWPIPENDGWYISDEEMERLTREAMKKPIVEDERKPDTAPNVRYSFYRLRVAMTDGTQLHVTVATRNKRNLDKLIEKNKVFWRQKMGEGFDGSPIYREMSHIAGLDEEIVPFNLPEAQYRVELMHANIVDDE